MRGTKRPSPQEARVARVQINFGCHPGLRDHLLKEMEKTRYSPEPESIGDIISRVMAEYFDDPEIAVVPRKPMGRPPKQRTPAA